VRTKVFTERDRRLLERWLEENEKTRETRKLFNWIRQNTPQLLADLKLMNRVITELKKRRGGGGGSSEASSSAQHHDTPGPHQAGQEEAELHKAPRGGNAGMRQDRRRPRDHQGTTQ